MTTQLFKFTARCEYNDFTHTSHGTITMVEPITEEDARATEKYLAQFDQNIIDFDPSQEFSNTANAIFVGANAQEWQGKTSYRGYVRAESEQAAREFLEKKYEFTKKFINVYEDHQ